MKVDCILLGHDMNPQENDRQEKTLLINAIEANPGDAVKLLLAQSKSDAEYVNTTTTDGQTALTLACTNGCSPEVINALLSAGADCNIQTTSIPSALHCVYKNGTKLSDFCGWNSTDEKLLDHGADPNHLFQRSTPLEFFLQDVFEEQYFQVFHCGNMKYVMKKVYSHVLAGMKMSNLSNDIILTLGVELLNPKYYLKVKINENGKSTESVCNEAFAALTDLLDILHGNRDFQVYLSGQTVVLGGVQFQLKPKKWGDPGSQTLLSLLHDYAGVPKLQTLAAVKIRQLLQPTARIGVKALERPLGQLILPQIKY